MDGYRATVKIDLNADDIGFTSLCRGFQRGGFEGWFQIVLLNALRQEPSISPDCQSYEV